MKEKEIKHSNWAKFSVPVMSVIGAMLLFLGMIGLLLIYREGYLNDVIALCSLISICLGFILSILSRIIKGRFVIKVDYSSVLMKDEHVIGILQNPGYFWKKRVKGVKFLKLSDTIVDIKMQLNPIIANQKMIKLNCKIVCGCDRRDISSLNAACKKFGIISIKSNIRRFVEDLFYEFQERYSIELSKFYNPIRQQGEFLKLVKIKLDPNLVPVGLKVLQLNFDV